MDSVMRGQTLRLAIVAAGILFFSFLVPQRSEALQMYVQNLENATSTNATLAFYKIPAGRSAPLGLKSIELIASTGGAAHSFRATVICRRFADYTGTCPEMPDFQVVTDSVGLTATATHYILPFTTGSTTPLISTRFYAFGIQRINGASHGIQLRGISAPSTCVITGCGLSGTPYVVVEDQTPEPGCTVNCYSNVLFIPGIESSRLYRPDTGGEEKLWEPGSEDDVHDLYLNAAGESIRPDIYTKVGDVLDEIPVTGSNVYKSLMNDLETWKTAENLIADYGVAPYDWRLTLGDVLNFGNVVYDKIYYSGDSRATSTPYIIQELRRLAGNSRNGKVTIIAHSNGGLVAKALLQKLEELNDPLLANIDSLILVAVPQTGTPQALGALLHGYDQALPNEMFPLILTPETAREFASNAPMVYHLLPSSAYIEGDGSEVRTPVVTFDEGVLTEPFIAEYGRAIGNSTELHSFLSGAEGRDSPAFDDLNNPSIASQGLLSYAEAAHATLDAWTPPPEITVHEIAGWGEETLASIRYFTSVECASVSATYKCLEYRPKLQYSPETVVDGDGTVVVPSALAMSTSSPNVTRWWVDLANYNGLLPDFLRKNHVNIFEVPQLREYIRQVFSSDTEVVPEYMLVQQPASEDIPRLVFTLHSPLNLSALDDLGNQISAELSEIPGAIYRRFGEVQYISVPASAHPTLQLDGYTSGSFNLQIKEVVADTIVASTTFAGIPTATTSKATMNFIDGTLVHASALSIDHTNDGVADVILNPLMNEIVIPYIDPPSTTIEIFGTQGTGGWYQSDVHVSFQVVDGSDAMTYFVLDANATSSGTSVSVGEGIHTLTYFSIDSAGNAEAPRSLSLKIDYTPPEVEISASSSTKDIVVNGLDNLSLTTVSQSANTTQITDEAGNQTKLVFSRTFTKGILTYARLVSIQYGTSTAIVVPSSFLLGWNTKITPPLLVSQTLVVSKIFGIQAVYDKSKDRTTIVVLKKNVPIQKVNVPGQAFVRLTTRKGVIDYLW